MAGIMTKKFAELYALYASKKEGKKMSARKSYFARSDK